MKKVLLISNYFHFATEKASNRYGTLTEMLAADPEIELEVITSAFYQRTKKHRTNYQELTAGLGYKVTFIQEPGYQKNVSLGRLYTGRVFAKNTMAYLKSIPKPDLIYQVVPTLDVAYAVSKYAQKHRIPFVIDIQDLWPEAFKMALNIPVVSDVLFAPYAWMAKRIYSNADAICAVSRTNVERARQVNTKDSTGHPVFIGIDLAAFDRNREAYPVAPKQERLQIGYCGSLDKSYDLKLVIDALALLENPPRLLVMGDGSQRAEFEAYAKERCVEAEFTGFVPYEKMCGMLCACHMTVNPIIGSSAASIINKHGDYAASGLPVLNTQSSPEYRELIDQYSMGFNCDQGNPADLAQKIRILSENKDLRIQMGQNARRCAEEKFDRNRTYQELVEVIKNYHEGADTFP